MLKTHLSSRLIAAGTLAVGLLIASHGFQPGFAAESPYSDQEKANLGSVIKEYLLKNPEVIRDAMAELERRDQVQRCAL